MKNLLLIILLFAPLIFKAQQGYTAVFAGYDNEWELTRGANEKYNGFIFGSGIEKYFKSRLKLSAGINYRYGRHIAEVTTPFTNPPTYLEYRTRHIQVPVTIGINLGKKNGPFQVFPFLGYNANMQLYSKSIRYTQGQTAPKIFETEQKTVRSGFFISGVETRYIFKKYFFGTGFSLNIKKTNHSGKFWYYSVGIKGGILLNR